MSSLTPHGFFFPSVDSSTCLGASQSLLLASLIKTHQVSALEIQFSCSVDNCQRGEPSHLFFRDTLQPSLPFISEHHGTNDFQVESHAHFFLTAGQDFICSCLLSRLPASIYSNRKFFFFYECSCLTLCLISPSKCPSPVFSLCLSWMHQQFHLGGCLTSWKDAGSAIRGLSLPSIIAPSLKSKYSLISCAASFSSMISRGLSLASGTRCIF